MLIRTRIIGTHRTRTRTVDSNQLIQVLNTTPVELRASVIGEKGPPGPDTQEALSELNNAQSLTLLFENNLI